MRLGRQKIRDLSWSSRSWSEMVVPAFVEILLEFREDECANIRDGAFGLYSLASSCSQGEVPVNLC